MARYAPGSQGRALMGQKAELARELLNRGLTVSQVSGQLACSKPFVRRVRDGMGDPPSHVQLLQAHP